MSYLKFESNLVTILLKNLPQRIDIFLVKLLEPDNSMESKKFKNLELSSFLKWKFLINWNY